MLHTCKYTIIDVFYIIKTIKDKKTITLKLKLHLKNTKKDKTLKLHH